MNNENIKNYQSKSGLSSWQRKLHEIIFEADTSGGKLFDILLIACILISVVVVFLDSITPIREKYGAGLYLFEWIFTIVFTIEYIFRLICVGNYIKYASSFYGTVDLLGILPTYLGLLFPAARYLIVIRILRVLRIFRVLKLVQYIYEAKLLSRALKESSRKITVFMFTVIILVVIVGSLMYIVEYQDQTSGFTSIPMSIYWAIVTITTVGYGDISPQTPVGQTLAAILMILGYSIIAVPTGIISVHVSDALKKNLNTQVCPSCNAEGHDNDASYCKYCGMKL